MSVPKRALSSQEREREKEREKMLQGVRMLERPELASPTASKPVTPPPPPPAEAMDEEAIARKTGTIIEELVQNRDFEVCNSNTFFSREIFMLVHQSLFSLLCCGRRRWSVSRNWSVLG